MIVVTGGSGQLGTAFRRLLPEAVFPPRRRLDLTVPASSWDVLDDVRPSMIINCAAYTSVDRAEDDEAAATAANGEGVARLVEYCRRRGIGLVTYSTDYVFDGADRRPYVESDPTSPINAYGRSKLIGEGYALEYENALVIRTSWLLSGSHPNFVATMLRMAGDGETVRVVNDQTGCPTIAADLADASLSAIAAGATGLLHLVNSGEATWFDLAQRAVGLAGMDPRLIQPCSSEEYETRARRPRYSVLGSHRLDDLGVASLPPWEDSLPAVVAEIERGTFPGAPQQTR
ncbi:MAG: dTDP-4-dehydrorhamnose reductase [Acidimicrobiia bacterium]|nr:dTDP-4-dehydrorhamnose reductase [Acidimicrobiia bacterium]